MQGDLRDSPHLSRTILIIQNTNLRQMKSSQQSEGCGVISSLYLEDGDSSGGERSHTIDRL